MRLGWNAPVQGPAHRIESETERATAMRAGVEPWPGGDRELFVRIMKPRGGGVLCAASVSIRCTDFRVMARAASSFGGSR